MKFRVLFTILALFALASLSFCQPASFSFEYPGDWECGSHSPLTYIGDCWVGIPIPNGTPITVYINGSPADTVLMNADDMCDASGGFFYFDYYLIVDGDDTVHLDLQYGDCHYWTNDTTLASGCQEFALTESDWNCECESCGPLVISISSGNAVLNWFPFGGTTYIIYGDTLPYTQGDSLDSVTDTTWTDAETATRPSPYFYYVTAVE